MRNLANVYWAQGREAEAGRLADRLALITEDILIRNKRRLEGEDYYILAVVGAGRISDDAVIDFLEKAFDNGYLESWRCHMVLGLDFGTLQDRPRFSALVEKIEVEMARQLAELDAGLALEDIKDEE